MNDLARFILGEKAAKVVKSETEAAEQPRSSSFGDSQHSETFREMAAGASPAAVSEGRRLGHSAAFAAFAQDHVANLHLKPQPRSKFGRTGQEFDSVYGGSATPSKEAMRAELEQLSARHEKLEAADDFDESSAEAQKLLRRMDELSEAYSALGADEDED